MIIILKNLNFNFFLIDGQLQVHDPLLVLLLVEIYQI